jgi:hypothetical protein
MGVGASSGAARHPRDAAPPGRQGRRRDAARGGRPSMARVAQVAGLTAVRDARDRCAASCARSRGRSGRAHGRTTRSCRVGGTRADVDWPARLTRGPARLPLVTVPHGGGRCASARRSGVRRSGGRSGRVRHRSARPSGGRCGGGRHSNVPSGGRRGCLRRGVVRSHGVRSGSPRLSGVRLGGRRHGGVLSGGARCSGLVRGSGRHAWDGCVGGPAGHAGCLGRWQVGRQVRSGCHNRGACRVGQGTRPC